MIHLQTGIGHILHTFNRLRAEDRAALMPYFTLGYPDADKSLDIVQSIAENGADLIELGVPFSDPLADGPTIQRSTQDALAKGITVHQCLELTGDLRRRGVVQPLILMGYFNPILSYGPEQFVTDAAKNGVDGLIVPDLPPEEAGELEQACRRWNLALIYLLAPTSTDERIQLVVERSSGFVYLVSVTGVTGARTTLSDDLEVFIQRVRNATNKPLAVGFGVSTAEQAGMIGRMADGVIIGSALIDAVRGSATPAVQAAAFIARVRAELEKARFPLSRASTD